MTDLVTFGETMLRLSPPAEHRLVDADTLTVQAAGAESNVAIAAAKLGTNVTWLSKVPDGPLGERVVTEVRSHGVTPAVVRSADGRQGTYYVEQGGSPRGTAVHYDRAGAAVTTATPDELDTAAVADGACLFTTGITPALSETLADTTATLLEQAEQTAFDLNYRSKLWSVDAARDIFDDLLPSVDLLFVPERDANAVLGATGAPETVAETLRTRYDCDTVVLTRGENGAIAVTNDQTVEQEAFEAETADPIGTGDAFVGGYLSQFVDGQPLADCLAWGAATAALKRTIAGDIALVSPDEVRSLLRSETADIDR